MTTGFVLLLLFDKQGLTGTQARNLYEMNGPNAITPLHQRSEIGKFLRHLVGGFSLLLLAASALSFVAFGVQYAKDTKDNVVDNVSCHLACIRCTSV